jgi:uncharacterized protein YbcC (UPF0753/DUF2309 family)
MTAILAQPADSARPDALAQLDVALLRAIDGACRRIAPLWPLKNFVAVNPFHGFAGQSFHATCATLHRVARIRMLMPRAFYRDAVQAGEVTDADLEASLAQVPPHWRAPRTLFDLKASLDQPAPPSARHPAVVATIAEVLDELASGDRLASRTAFMTDEISRWCAAYFDEGQSVWRLPSRSLRPYAAWRDSMRHDRNAEAMGIRGFRAIVAALPDDPVAAIGEVVDQIGVPERAFEDYLHQALLDIGGWAAYARYIVWNAELDGNTDDTLAQLLAIRVVWGYALFRQRSDSAFKAAWRRAMEVAALQPLDEQLGDDPGLCTDMIFHEAYEAAFRRRALSLLTATPAPSPAQPGLQAAFCIDVRSEIYRRALESIRPDAETLGFAGFFGLPIEYVPVGHVVGRSHCPVLLKPAFTVCESVRGASEKDNASILRLRQLRRRVGKAWKSFKLSAISSFIYVETAGLLFAVKILSDSLALTRTVHDPNTDGMDEDVIRRLGPRLDPGMETGRQTGFPPGSRLVMAEAILRAMSMTTRFARLVMLTGHGSTTVNNPHASSLDCGACGGNTGEVNARVAAFILNDPGIRAELRSKGITIPDGTWFLGCLHDTTTDDITICDEDEIPQSHAAEVRRLRADLAHATQIAQAERAPSLGITETHAISSEIRARSRDWAQTRPEWGLAGNAVFIAAPRPRTRGLDLRGRAFLHEYDWRLDQDFSTLALIMSAPMVVAAWINLQYYGSTVNNDAFGCGNKVLHNVTGTIGVLEGNAGDLKLGLPWQSVHDGKKFVHAPVRLSVFIAAPQAAINDVIAKHELVRHLVDNRWLHLFTLDETGPGLSQYTGNYQWTSAIAEQPQT